MVPVPRSGAQSPGTSGRTNDSGDECPVGGGCGTDACGRRRDDRFSKPGLSVSCRWSVSHLPSSTLKNMDMASERLQTASTAAADGSAVRVGSPGGWRPTHYLDRGEAALSRVTSEGTSPSVQSLGPEQLEQTFLDFGQRGASTPVTCPECGYTYVIGVATDERAHANEHQLALYGVLLTRVRFMDAVVGNESDPEHRWRAQELVPGWVVRVDNNRGSGRKAQDSPGTGLVLHVRQRWFQTLWRLACKDWDVQTQTLEHPLSFEKEALFYDAAVAIFAYVGKQRRNAIGMIVARPLQLPERPNGDHHRVPWCGIERIWVHAAFRRCGVATALADVARAHVWAATVVPRHRCAFTELTSAGDAFANIYIGERNQIRFYSA